MSEDANRPPRLDVTGLRCPLPVLMTAREMRKLPPGAVLEVVGDDPAIAEDMPIWCADTGNPLVSLVREGVVILCRVEKRGPG